MLEINLLPDDMRARPREQNTSGPAFKFDKKYIIYIVPAVLALVIFIHLVLGVIFVFKGLQYSALNNEWKKLEAKRSALNSYQEAHSMLTQDAMLIQQLDRQRVNWAVKLNKISLGIPSGVWLNDLSVNSKELTLQGSVISLQKEEMGLLDKFMDAMRDDPVFFADFTALELGQVLKKQVGGYEVSDFTIKGDLKQR